MSNYKITIESKDEIKTFNTNSFFVSLKNEEQEEDGYEILYQCKDHQIFKFAETLIYVQHNVVQSACCKNRKKLLLKTLVNFAKDDLESKEYILKNFLEKENDE